jgi:amidophosphoribosyltransferase
MNESLFLNERDKMEEECGVFGIYTAGKKEVGELTYYALYALQHRGQESAGITVSNDGELSTYKGMGLAADVFTKESLNNLIGNAAIGHVRYSTTGESRIENAQPLENRFKLGQVAVAHNGNLTNSKIIKELLEDGGASFHTTIDSEVIIKLIARKAANGFEEAIRSSVSAIKGAFALVVLADNKLIGVRDPYGIRPLIIGKSKFGDYYLASESCAIDAIGGEVIRDVGAGEMVIIDENGIKSIVYSEINKMNACSFEYIYFARPDSTIDGINVYLSRVESGRRLAKQMKIDADIVIGVPDSGIPAAIGYAEASGIPYGIGLIKNKYIGRTFIAPSQELREQAVAVKLNPLKVNLEGKKVVIIDDSLVRGTTSKKLVEIIRGAGAKEVHFRLASPPVRFSCYYGIDTARREELMASRLSVEEIRKEINADTLDYLSLENMMESIGNDDYCTGCFCGEYPMCTPNEF